MQTGTLEGKGYRNRQGIEKLANQLGQENASHWIMINTLGSSIIDTKWDPGKNTVRMFKP